MVSDLSTCLFATVFWILRQGSRSLFSSIHQLQPDFSEFCPFSSGMIFFVLGKRNIPSFIVVLVGTYFLPPSAPPPPAVFRPLSILSLITSTLHFWHSEPLTRFLEDSPDWSNHNPDRWPSGGEFPRRACQVPQTFRFDWSSGRF